MIAARNEWPPPRMEGNPPNDPAATPATEPRQRSIVGPDALSVRQVSWRGPFARRGSVMGLRPAAFSVVNAGHAALAVDRIALDPLRRDGAGTSAAGELCARPGSAADPLPAGASLGLVLAGTIPRSAGRYCTTVRILAGPGDGLAVPVTVDVSAAPLWGVLCMLLGLFLLGAINLLAGEGAVRTRLHDALRARKDIHALLEANPVPQSRAGDVEAMDHDFDAAIAGLGLRRPASVVDHREAEAQPLLDEAGRLSAGLRAELTGLPRGAAEVEDVRRDWTGLQSTLQQIAALPAGMPAQGEPGFAGKLDAFLLRFRNRLLRDPASAVVAEISTEFGRMALEEAAGEGDAARALALNTRLWLRRSAVALNRALTGYRIAIVEAGWMLDTDRVMRERAAHDDLAPADRDAMLALLDQAAGQLDGEPWLDNLRESNRLLDAAWTAQVRGAGAMQTIRLDQAIAAADARTDSTDIEAVTAQLQAAPRPHTLAMKQAGLTRILALWRAHVAQVDEPPVRDRLARQINAVQAIVSSGRILDAVAPYRALLAGWTAWNGRLVQRALDALQHPRCLEIYADLERNAARIEASLREQPASAQVDAWDRALDRIGLDMRRQGPDAAMVSADCISPLLDIDRRVNALSAAIFTANLLDLPLPALTLVRLAAASGDAAAIAAAALNRDRPRLLTLEAATPPAERVVGRRLTFAVGGGDPAWGAATTIRVDFGDGGPPFVASAEAMRQGRQVEHEFAAPLTAHLSVSAIADPRPGETAGTMLGQGRATILVAPSPATGAQRLADDFINLRFALALLIALTAYFWRYHSRAAIFGARGYDYVEAFALGFAADAAVSHLPQAVAAFAP